MRNWRAGRRREKKEREKKRPNARKTIWLAAWWMLLELFLSSLSAFLFLSLSPSLLSLCLFLQTRWQHQSKEKSRSVMWCARTHAGERVRRHSDELPSKTIYSLRTTTTTSFNVRRGDDDLLSGSLFFMADTGREWCRWRPPCCFHSSLNQTQSINKMNHTLLHWEQAGV